ncbi:hypothetical protein O3P69_013008 [Scylla paramamosain]|uniref:Secreted protein n=1 Tax=Scylla paramamosain TaxID=85552 RepID=A0AAW0TRF1_SCYPA
MACHAVRHIIPLASHSSVLWAVCCQRNDVTSGGHSHTGGDTACSVLCFPSPCPVDGPGKNKTLFGFSQRVETRHSEKFRLGNITGTVALPRLPVWPRGGAVWCCPVVGEGAAPPWRCVTTLRPSVAQLNTLSNAQNTLPSRLPWREVLTWPGLAWHQQACASLRTVMSKET